MRPFLVMAMFFFASVAQAAEIGLSVPEVEEAETSTIAYRCEGQEFSVDYVNAGPVSLAVFAIEGTTIVASNVLSASGARYAGSHYIWWTKGPQGDLYDLMKSEDAPAISCVEAS